MGDTDSTALCSRVTVVPESYGYIDDKNPYPEWEGTHVTISQRHWVSYTATNS